MLGPGLQAWPAGHCPLPLLPTTDDCGFGSDEDEGPFFSPQNPKPTLKEALVELGFDFKEGAFGVGPCPSELSEDEGALLLEALDGEAPLGGEDAPAEPE